jgi:hypothetical protein
LARRRNRGVGRDLVGADQPSYGKDEDGRKDTFLEHTREPPGLFAHRLQWGRGLFSWSVGGKFRRIFEQISCQKKTFSEI